MNVYPPVLACGNSLFPPGEFRVRVSILLGRDPSERFVQDYHPELEFHLIRHGVSKYNIRGVEYPCEKNSLLIIHENEPHVYITSEECEDKNMCLIFAAEVMQDRVIARTALQRLAPLHHLILSEQEANIADYLIAEIGAERLHRDMHWQQVITDYVETFLTILYRAAGRPAFVPESEDPLIQEVVKYLENKFAENPPLTHVAKKFNIPSYALSKKFTQYMGLGFREYMIQRRILIAQKMLERTDSKVSAIAKKVGFDSLTTFNRDFRMLTGVTPAVYRRISWMDELSTEAARWSVEAQQWIKERDSREG
jgi:AraC-like DNA-binding protein